MMEAWSQSQYLKLGFRCSLLALKKPESCYFCCILSVWPERGRYRMWAKILTVLETMSAVPSMSLQNGRPGLPRKDLNLDKKVRARWRQKRRAEERGRGKYRLCSKTPKIINSEKNSQIRIGRLMYQQ